MENQLANEDKRPSAYRDAIPGARPAQMTKAMRMYQKHGSPRKHLDVEFSVIEKAEAELPKAPSGDVLIITGTANSGDPGVFINE